MNGGIKEMICQALESPSVRKALVQELNKLVDIPFISEDLEEKLLGVLVEIAIRQAKMGLGCAED
jgi:hypothetical protein